MIVPKYLENLTKVKKITKNSVEVEVICECGCAEFQVYENVVVRSAAQIEEEKEFEAFEKRLRWRSYNVGALKDGKTYAYRKNIFGIVVDKVELPSELARMDVIKIKCVKCGMSNIIFDSRLHGYTAVIDKQKYFSTEEIKFGQKKIKKSDNDICGIEIEIIHDISIEEFNDDFDNGIMNIEEYSNAFGDITIYARIRELNNKRVEIFSEETA